MTLDGRRATWQATTDRTIWLVDDNPADRLDVADPILDRAVSQR